MKPSKNLRGPCTQCGRSIVYPAEQIGTTISCPHCGKLTELQLEKPPEEPVVPRRVIWWTIVAVLILLLGIAGLFYALKRSQSWVEQHRPKPEQIR